MRQTGDAGAYLRAQGQRLQSATEVRVGFLEGSMGGRDADVPAPSLAYILDFGAPKAGIPPRPFFRSMVGQKRASWGKLLAAALRKTGDDGAAALAIVGDTIRTQLQRSMDDFTPYWKNQADMERMKRRKGFLRVLEDSKNLRNSASFEVR